MIRNITDYRGSIVVGMLGVLFAIGLFTVLVKLKRSRASGTFKEMVNKRHKALQRVLNHAEDHLRAVRVFFRSSKNVTREEFQRFTTPFVERTNVDWLGLYWLPPVSPEQPGDTPGEHIEMTSNRTISSGSFEEVAFPVKFSMEDGVRNFERGQNLLENDLFNSMLRNGLSSGSLQVSPPLFLSRSEDREAVLWLFSPVFDRKLENAGEQGKQRKFDGFIGGVLNLTATFQPLFSEPRRMLFASLEPNEIGDEAGSLKFPSTKSRQKMSQVSWFRRTLYGSFHRSKPLSVASRTWEVSYSASPAFVRTLNPWIAPGAAVLVLVLTGVLMLYLGTLRNRNRVINAAVDEQTRKLKKAKRREEEANRAKSEFLARMSHEIRTPLNAVKGMTELLEKSSLTPEQEEYVDISKKSTEALMSLVNDILDLSKVEAGELELNREPFKLEQFVLDTVSYFARQASEKGLELHVFVDGDCPAVVVEDKQRLRQIQINLVSNAVKFTNEGEVVVRVLPGDQENDHQILEFRIVDTGIGISEEAQDQLFRKFTQGEAGMSPEYDGTGLGLAICKTLVERMGGGIEVESEKDRGTTFSFWIPVRLPDEGQKEEKVSQMASDQLQDELSGINALAVDDSSTNRLILKTILKKWGATVTEVQDGAGAIREVRDAVENGSTYDLVLLDRTLEDMDAYQLCDELKEYVDQDRMVIMVTSEELSEDREKIERLGLGNYMLKPVDWSSLMDTVSRILGREEENLSPDTDIIMEKPDRRLGSFDSRPSILIAEDNEHNRKLMGAIFSDYPVELEFSKNGEEALAKSKSGSYDLIFMDMRMPKMGGLEATRSFRKWEEEQGIEQTPIVALTARALVEHRRESLEAGCDEHLTKPVDEDMLIDTCRRILSESMPDGPDPGGNEDATDKSEPRENVKTVDERFRDLVPELIEDVKRKMSSIRAKAEESDFDEIEDLAHDVRGSSGNFGFEYVQEKAQEMESLARDKKGGERIQSIASEVSTYVQNLEIQYE